MSKLFRSSFFHLALRTGLEEMGAFGSFPLCFELLIALSVFLCLTCLARPALVLNYIF